MERKYRLDLNGNWTVFQECTNSRIQFDTRCGSSGSWTTDMRCPAISKKEYYIESPRERERGKKIRKKNLGRQALTF